MNFPTPHDRVLPHLITITKPPKTQEPEGDIKLNRIRGSLLGLAVGDALGASVEFRPRQFLKSHPVQRMQSGGTWGLKAGHWTDDTSMALCLASSLLTTKKFDPYNQMVRYKWWYKHGYLSSTGHCFDIGSATRRSLDTFCSRQKELMKTLSVRTESDVDKLSFDEVREVVPTFVVDCGEKNKAGNGALMRLAPVPLFAFRQPCMAIQLSGESAQLTHGDKKAIDACRYYGALIVAAIHGESHATLTDTSFYERHKQWFGSDDLHDEVLRIAKGSYLGKDGYEQGIRGKGYVLDSLEAALWAFGKYKGSFDEGVLAAVNLGDDTDTTAAIYGQLAGACYGADQISPEWLKKLYAKDLISNIGDWLYYQGGLSIPKDDHQKEPSYQHLYSAENQHRNNHSANESISTAMNSLESYSQSKSTIHSADDATIQQQSQKRPNFPVSIDKNTHDSLNSTSSSIQSANLPNHTKTDNTNKQRSDWD